MKLGNFSGLLPQVVELRCDKNTLLKKNEWSPKDEVRLACDSGVFVLQQGDQLISVLPAKDKEDLRYRVERGETLWALTSIKKNSLYIRGVELAKANTQLDLDMGVTPFQTEQLFKRGDIANDSMEEAVQWLQEEFILEGEQQPRLVTALYAGNVSGTLEILGKEWVATLSEQDNYWTITRLTKTRRRGAVLRILQGNIRFIDASAASQLENPTYRQALDNSERDYGSYIQLWQQYNHMEWVINLEAARALGALPFAESSKGNKVRTWDFIAIPERAAAFLERWKEVVGRRGGRDEMLLEVVLHLPDWLDNDQELESTGLDKNRGKPWLAELIGIDDGLITLQLKGDRDRKPISKGFICLSMHGYRINRERRFKAVQQIQNRANPMRQLHSLLQGLSVPVDRTKRLKAITPTARARFKGEPTRKQKEALEVALRTPDLAIIIGPPGTGKTQVITALQARLAEEFKDQPVQYQTLISSFQHDAVDNVMERSDVFGLPAIKVGGKLSKKGDAQSDPLASWCSNRAVSLEKDLAILLGREPVFDVIKVLQKQLTVLRVSKPGYQEKAEGITNINTALSQLSSVYKIRLSPTVQQRWHEWSEHFLDVSATHTGEENHYLLRHVRALRTTIDGYSDDGAIQCARLIDALGRKKYQLPEDQNSFLRALCSEFSPSGEQLCHLKDIKKILLDRLIPDYRPRHVQEVLSEEDCEVLSDIYNDINKTLKATHNLAYLNVLSEYKSALKHSPQIIRRAVEEYTTVLGATCQQAAGNQMIDLQQVRFQDQIGFDTVVVDEAARANPLDLMIPMAMGRKRIILVGDHRQLPHLLEPKVEEELAEKFELDQVQQEMFRISLFERLIKSLRELKNERGQPKRVVMLDTQFRMHPVLGRFVSEQFYERHGLDEVKAGLPAEAFSHHVQGFENKVCGWIHVPVRSGKNQRFNGSLKRDVEASAIATEAKRILETCPDLSVGVITFYSAQVNSILEAMEKEGLTHKKQIRPEWQFIEHKDGSRAERLRVGSVDAFQGKEFDVVLLSIVRTDPGKVDPSDEEALNRAYGFLRLDNRLNVAMSRQHRLLIAVGDTSLATHPATEEAAPSLAAFYRLCESDYGTVH